MEEDDFKDAKMRDHDAFLYAVLELSARSNDFPYKGKIHVS